MQGFTGHPIKVHRIGRDGGAITNPQLVINTSVQPKVSNEIIGDENAIGRGAAGRFLIFTAYSNVDYRKVKANREDPIDQELINRWNQTIRKLLSMKEHRLFDITEDQIQQLDQMRERNERQLRDPEIRLDELGTRLPGLLKRIAQFFIMIENPQTLQMDDACLGHALGLADYLIESRMQADAKTNRSHVQRWVDGTL